MEGLFLESGIPSYEDFRSKLISLAKLSTARETKKRRLSKLFIKGNIVYLPNKGTGVFVGDVHGDLEAVVSIVNQIDFLTRMERDAKLFLTFLGDYGDRGYKIIETINEIITLKLRYPRNVILLRGNHEEREKAMVFGTYDAFLQKYDRERGQFLFNFYCDVMGRLPVVAVTANGIIAVHGGIPNKDIKSLKILNTYEGESYAREMVCNDPDPSISERTYSVRGPTERRFGEAAFDRFMKAVPADLMLRSHQWPKNGEELLFGGRLATIFSNGSANSKASFYGRKCDHPTFLKVDLETQRDKFEKSDFIEVLYQD